MDTIENFRGKYNFLSNFSGHRVKYDGVTWETSEHAYQAAKTHDKDEKTMIQLCLTPGASKKAGKKITLRDDWDQVKLGIMDRIVHSKFAGNSSLTRKLLATEDAEIIEGNSWGDSYWGVCEGKGQNNLGKILMKVRGEIRSHEVG